MIPFLLKWQRNIITKQIWFVFIVFFSCSDKIPLVNRINSKEDLPTVSIENLKTTYTEEGKVKGKLQAQLAEHYEGIVEPYVDFKKGLSIVLYNKENKIETSLTADRAIWYEAKHTWEATGNVVISNMNGDILRTEKLYGDEKEKKIFTDQFVQITKSNGSVVNGKSGFESNTEFTIYKFIDVSGKIFFREEFNADKDIENNPPPGTKISDEKPTVPKIINPK
jgi:LPS export ABC transporter protein LptC